MSVQLIVYPQNYDGQISSFSSTSTEVLVNGINFIGLNSTSSADVPSSTNLGQFLGLYPPAIVNTWYRFRTTVYNTPSFAAEVSGNLVLDSVGALGQVDLCGVYQQLSNLTIGQNYTVTIEISIPSAVGGGIFVAIFDGTTPSPGVSQVFVASVPQITSTFTATSTNNTVMITFLSSNTETVTISSISINPEGVTPNLTTFELTNGQVICDLYEDEDIPLSLSVDNFKNVAEKVQSYSKAFKLPATKRNNLIFDNMFEITRSDDGIIFNPYNKTECVLKQDGFILFKGYLKMLDITDKEGEISYNVNLYSEVVALADILKDRTFSELDFSELTHDYDKASIKGSWYEPSTGTGLPLTTPLPTSSYAYDTTNQPAYGASQTNVLKYPFVDWNHQILISDGTSGIAGLPQLTSLEQAFRPFIQLKYLINRIFEATPFTWESSFFDTAEFGKLFMDFNWGSDNQPIQEFIDTFNGYYMFGTGDGSGANVATTSFTEMILSYNIPLVGGLTPTNYDDATNIITSTVLNESYSINYSYSIKNTDSSARTVECQWLYNSTPINNTGIVTIAAGATYVFSGSFTQVMTTIGDTLKAQFKASAGSVVEQLQNAFPLSGASVIFSLGVSSVTSDVILQTLRGELGQWEFLKGIMTMFNIVSIPDEDNPNNIKFEPYGDVFISDTNSGATSDMTLAARSIQHDWTDKIDISEMKLTPLTDLNKNTIFKFAEDDDDFAFTNYKNQVGGHLYGSKKFDASISSGGLATVLQGTNEVIADPFAATVVKPWDEQFPGLIVPALYAMSDDETEGFDNSPRILYNNGRKDSGITYYIPAQNGLSSENQTHFLQFSHLTNIPTVVSIPPATTDTNDFHFGMCQLIPPVGDSTPNNLFNLYWLPYYLELYNPDTRTMTIKVNLSPSEINTFKFNDTVMIKNRQFRVNKIDYKPNDLATVEFILIP
jgi:hypothetical protein